MKKLLTALVLLSCVGVKAQSADDSWKTIYRPSATKINDLIHTKIDVSFDYNKSWMYGKVWISLHPHFYPTDSLSLDAKGMTIEEVSLVSAGKNIPLHYTYDSMNIHITLNKIYKNNETYTIYVKYISKPDGYKANIYTMMGGQKGLYFINPKGEIKNKPIQIWTQGETEANSYWVPTIDKPDQKTTDEITMTVPAKYVTLSNGLLTSSKTNGDGTRSDTWKMDLPHAPYLMFMGVGDYAIIKDHYKNKEVSYYVEKDYAPVARKIFGNTPEMITFFSRITGVDFPWQKYNQITGRDYIFGAMENTSATLHEENSQQDARQLVDGNFWEETIAHELFHQWFGDYVTCESWSNATVNESFADYSETLWDEYKYGKEAGQAQIYSDLRNYVDNPSNATEDLVRFHYKNVFEAFDAVTYQKGGCILNMLRNYIGDSAFFKSLNVYLTTNKFKNGEAQQFRLAVEEVTGQDMNWFFNQWYYSNGHPKLDISYAYDAGNKTATVSMKQTQGGKTFKLPFAIDVYEGSKKTRYKVWMNDSIATYSFPSNAVPDLINVDADKMLVCEKTDHKTADNFIFQYNHAASYIDRREAIAFFINHKDEAKRIEFLQNALKEKNERLRRFTLQRLDMSNDTVQHAFEPILVSLIKNDPKSMVRADAIADLGNFKKAEYKQLFTKATSDSSYSVAGNALTALGKIDSLAALAIAKSLSTKPAKGTLQSSINEVLSNYGDESSYNYIYNQFYEGGINSKFGLMDPISTVLAKDKNNDVVKKNVDAIVSFRDELPDFIKQFAGGQVNSTLGSIAAAKQAGGSTELADYIKTKIPVGPTPTPTMQMPANSLQKYAGEYEVSGTTIKISAREGVLYMFVPGQLEYTLVPTDINKFTLKGLSGFSVQFNTNASGAVTELLSIQPNGTFTARKTK